MNRGLALCASLALIALAPAASAQAPDMSKIEVKVTDLGHNIYLLEGAGGNVTAAVAQDGVILIDSQAMAMAPKLEAAVQAKTKAPIKFLINTHYHGDHVAGDPYFVAKGALVIAQDNDRKRLMLPIKNSSTGEIDPTPVPPAELPSITYATAMTLHLNGQTAQLSHPPMPAHTDGDTVIFFPDANVLIAGDIYQSHYPNVDVDSGGGINGMIAGTDILLKMANDQTKIVPGHGPLGDKAHLTKYRAMLVSVRDHIKAEIDAGKTEDQMVADNPTKETDADWKGTSVFGPLFPRLVYRSLKKNQ
jgi:glyoxylase-like metal-dependent hydrolase (beta-lactamase superfamily II)